MVVVASCSHDKLIPLLQLYLVNGETGVATLNVCTTAPVAKNTEVDYFFAVDVSGSNSQNLLLGNDGLPVSPPVLKPGTNPNGDMSFGAISTFLSNINANDTNNMFSLIEFSTNPALKVSLTNNLSQFKNYIRTEWNNKPFSGWTNYVDTLAMIQAQIQNIINAEKQSINPKQHVVQIIFTSDGAPFVLGSNNQVFLQNAPGILNQIRAMETLVSQYPQYLRSIVFNTIYFYVTVDDYTSYDPVAVQLMQNMAKAGFGRYYNASLGQAPDYSSFLVPQIREPYKFSDLFVNNMNVTWVGANQEIATDGLLADSIRLKGGAPTSVISSGSPDSDSNGVSDLVEYTVNNHKICNDPQCSPAASTKYQNTICNAYALPITGNAGIKYSTNIVPGGIFNDCELKLLNANLDGTGLISGTGVPQDLAALMFYPIAIQSPTNWLFSSPFGDQYTGYQRIKYHVAPSVSANELVGLKPYTYKLEYKGQTDKLQDCYTATVSDIGLSSSGGTDLIRAYFIEAGVQSSTPHVRTSTKTMNTDGTVTFDDSDLK